MQELLIGLLIGAVGLVLLFAGYRFARVLLPIWGFIAGFSAGAAITADISSSDFLGSLFGILVGLFVGLLFAVLIYAYFYVAIILAGATLGYWLGSGFIGLFGVEPGLLTAMSGIAVGAAFAAVGMAMNMPKAFLVIITSIIGATSLIGALLLIFNQIPLEFFNYRTVQETVSNSFVWSALAVVGSFVGMVAQFLVSRNFELEEWSMEDTHHTTPHAPTATHA